MVLTPTHSPADLPLLYQLELWLEDSDPSHFWGPDACCVGCGAHLSWLLRRDLCGADRFKPQPDDVDAMRARRESLRRSMLAIAKSELSIQAPRRRASARAMN